MKPSSPVILDLSHKYRLGYCSVWCSWPQDGAARSKLLIAQVAYADTDLDDAALTQHVASQDSEGL